MNLADYLESLSPEERDAWSDGPDARVAARGRPFTDPGMGVVYRPAAAPIAPASTYATRSSYAGPAPVARIAPTPTPPVDLATWRSAVSQAALLLAGSVQAVLMRYPQSPVTSALFLTPLRTFGVRVLDSNAVTIDGARSALNALAGLLSGVSFVSAGGAAELRAGLDRIIAMVPPSSTLGPTWRPNPSAPGGGGGIGPSSPGGAPPGTSPGGGGGGGGGGGSTSGCPTNASPVPGGCGCNPGFEPDAAGTACVPVASVPGGGAAPPPPPTRPVAAASSMGWLWLLGGAALAYRALGK